MKRPDDPPTDQRLPSVALAPLMGSGILEFPFISQLKTAKRTSVWRHVGIDTFCAPVYAPYHDRQGRRIEDRCSG